MQQCQSLFCAAAESRRGPWKTVVYHRYPKLGLGLRHQLSFYFWRLGWAAVRGRTWTSSDRSSRRPAADASDPDGRRRRLRLRAEPPFRPRAMRHPHDHSPQARPANDKTRHGKISTTDAGPVSTAMLITAIPSRNGDVDDQASSGLACSRSQPPLPCRDLRLMVLTHNLMILICVALFY